MEPEDQTPLTTVKPAKPARRSSANTVVGAALGALVAVFAVLNAQSVAVDWIVSKTSTPLIVVIVLSLLIGFAVGFLYARRHRAGGRGRRGRP